MPLASYPPLVSAICPTKNRRKFIPQLLKNFADQTWQSKELLIADDGDDSVADLCSGIPNLRYIRLKEPLTIGAKRNILCEVAQGEIVAHFDDDDWYSPGYIEHHVGTLRRHDVAVTGLYDAPFVNRMTGRAFHYKNSKDYAIGATLCFQRRYWLTHRFQDVNIAEDNLFLRTVQCGEYVFTAGNKLFVGTDHGHNTSPRDYKRSDAFDGSELLSLIGQTKPKTKPSKAKPTD